MRESTEAANAMNSEHLSHYSLRSETIALLYSQLSSEQNNSHVAMPFILVLQCHNYYYIAEY